MIYKAWEKFEGDKVVATSPFSDKIFEFIPQGGRVLDLGCGNGRISKLIKEHGYETYGVDVNADAIAFAQRDPELTGIDFSVQDAAATEYASDFFDAVIEQAVLACMDKPDRMLVMQEVHRILKPGGVFSLAEFGIREDRTEKYKADAVITGEYGTRIIKHPDGSEWYRSHNFNKGELDTLIKDAGFEIMHYTNPDFHTLTGNTHSGHQYVVRKL